MPYQFITSAKLPTEHGDFDIHMFENEAGEEHVLLTVGLPVVSQDTGKDAPNDQSLTNTLNQSLEKACSPSLDETFNQSADSNSTFIVNALSRPVPLVRIHSECLTGDAFGSLKCDCGPQLNAAMKAIQSSGCGAILYLRQEGRGIGLTNKIRAYALQDQGHDTLDANLLLGFPADARVYDMCAPMLAHVGVNQVRLLTNNPNKVAYLSTHGIEVIERVPLVVGHNAYNSSYMATKRDRMGHLLNDDSE